MSDSREMSRATERFTAAVEEFSRQVERLRPREPLDEKEADRFGNEAVHETREHLAGPVELEHQRAPLSGDEIEAWVEARDERRRDEGYEPI